MERHNVEAALRQVERLPALTDAYQLRDATKATVMAVANVERELRIQNLLDMSKMLQDRGKTDIAEDMLYDAVTMAGYDLA